MNNGRMYTDDADIDEQWEDVLVDADIDEQWEDVPVDVDLDEQWDDVHSGC